VIEVQGVREMRKSDLPVIMAWYREAFTLNFPLGDWAKIERAVKLRLLHALDPESGEVVLVAEGEAGLLLAYLWLVRGRAGDAAEVATIEGLSVHREYRRRGIGTFMADAAQDWAFRLLGVQRLHAIVSLTNEPVLGLLNKTGSNARFVTYTKEKPQWTATEQ
jgi:ribosomal protein S18 acetylase RimI-like enzyme